MKEYIPTEEDLKEAEVFFKTNQGLEIKKMLCHFAWRHARNAYKESFRVIMALEISEEHEGANIPISDLFENAIIHNLGESK